MSSFIIPFSLSFVLSCSSKEDKVLPQEECVEIFQEILFTQDARDQLSSQMNMLSLERRRNTIDKEKYIIAFDTWLQKEAKLRGDVTSLYDIAYSKGCFEEELG